MGKFYAVGVGAGNPLYITMEALRTLEKCDVIAVPVKRMNEESTALKIVQGIMDTSKKRIEKLEFIMARERSVRLASRKKAIEQVKGLLEQNMNVAMITLGDVSVYSTGTYVYQSISQAGFEAEIISGVPSFCASAAKAGISLCEEEESLCIIPAVKTAGKLETLLSLFENIVIMKAGKSLDEIAAILQKYQHSFEAVVIGNVGMEEEMVVPLQERNQICGYFTTVMIKRIKK